nr:atp-dependent clpx-like chaperone, mitochondrial [Quercus suber]
MSTSAPSPVSPQARSTYLAIAAVLHPPTATVTRCRPSRNPLYTFASRRQPRRNYSSTTYRRADFTNQPYTGLYEPNESTTGPLRDASQIGVPRVTPKILKQHLDDFVVGQDRAKRMLATAVYNHYQRIQELQRRDDEQEELLAQEERRRSAGQTRHPVEGRETDLKRGIHVPSLTREWLDQDEYPGQQTTTYAPDPTWRSIQVPTRSSPQGPQADTDRAKPQAPLVDNSPLTIEKSNVLLLGPSGVGKTLMAKTLARVLDVPFSMSDCTPFTQAGYIGEDADVCVQRLLAAADYDVAKAERGIICLDEIDKIATAKVSHGKDVSGEGVQQALLKIIEGTTLQIQAKQDRNAGNANNSRQGGYSANPLSGGGASQQSGAGGNKGEIFNVRTDNILFVCAGAFNGLHRVVLDRISKGSIGFGATIRTTPLSGNTDDSNHHETILEGEDALFEKHLPYYSPPSRSLDPAAAVTKRTFNTLDLVEPQDLQKFGLIPELIGRIPLSCALSSLSVSALVQVLTEPRNSLLQQYKQLFALSSIELRLTTPALHTIARAASKMGTGARGLRTVMERLLADAMYETPGSGVKYVLITESVAEREQAALYFFRGEGSRFQDVATQDEESWIDRQQRAEQDDHSFTARARNNSQGGAARTFEEYREKATAAGFV